MLVNDQVWGFSVMNYFFISFFSGGAIFLLQTDLGGMLAPVFAVLAAVVTVIGQLKNKKLENQLATQSIQQTATEQVINAWKILFERQGAEMRDVRRRLNSAELHMRVCDKTTYKLVMQLIKAGVDVDLEILMAEIKLAEKVAHEDIENTQNPPTPAAS